MRCREVLLAVLAFVVLSVSSVSYAQTWGPNANSFNYYAVDTVAEGGNQFSLRSATGIGKTIQLGFTAPHDDSLESDDTSGNPVPLALPFPFRYFGQIYTGAYICTNGSMCLVNDANAAKYDEALATNSWNWDMTAGGVPRFNDNSPVPTIMCWQNDMNAISAQLHFATVAVGGVNEFIVEWRNISYVNSTITSTIWCQAILQSSGKIILQYQTSLSSNDSSDATADPAVGICGPDPLGNQSVLACYTMASNADGFPGSGSAITFFPPPPPPTITVLHPNGGELFYTGDTLNVSWTVQNGPLSSADIAISLNGGFTWSTIGTNVPDASGGTFQWVITSAPSTQCLIRVSDSALASTLDASDTVFEIRVAPPGFTITVPGGTGKLDWVVGEVMNIAWVAVGTVGTNVTLQVSRDFGLTWQNIATNINPKTTTSFAWTVSAPHTDGLRQCFIKMDDGQGNVAVSAPPFAIFDVPVFDLQYPNGSETVYIDTPTKILWYSQGLVGFFVSIELSRDGGINWETITGGTNNDGEYDWIPTNPTTSTAKVRISTSFGGVTYTDTTAGLFTISETAALAVTSPNGGETFTVGDKTTVTWSSRGSGVGNFVKIELSRDGGQNWETITESAQNIGYYIWTVTGPITERAILAISPVNNPSATDVSDGTFNITAPRGLYLIGPVGGESFFLGEILEIQWFTSGNTGLSVRIEVSRNGGLTWETIIADTPNDGSHTWVVAGELSDQCRVRVTSVTYAEYFAVSPGSFRVSELIDTVIFEPFRGQIWERNTYRSVRWKPSILGSAKVRVEVLRKGQTAEVVAISTENDGVYEWFVSGVNSDCQVRISSLENLAKNYVSDIFSIIERYSITVDAMGMDASGTSGAPIPFRVIANPDGNFSSAEFAVSFNPAVFYIAEALAVEKGVALTGWGMNVDIDNENGTLLVTLDGVTTSTMPAEAFTIRFSVYVGAETGTFDIVFNSVKFGGTATTSVQAGKITVTATGDGGLDIPVRGGGGCFIATAAFGSMTADSVSSLCSLRDSSLGTSCTGSSLVSLYYATSPSAAVRFSSSLGAVVRRIID